MIPISLVLNDEPLEADAVHVTSASPYSPFLCIVSDIKLKPLSGSDTDAVNEDGAKLMCPLAAASGTLALTVKEVVLIRGEDGSVNKDPKQTDIINTNT